MDTSSAAMRPQGIDTAVLPGLFARLDPAVAQQLKRQLAADLVALRAALDAALRPPPDFVVAARQAHVLVALAGTAGAVTLTARARVLLDAATACDAALCTDLATGIFPEIDGLVGFVRSCPVPHNRSAS
jgi:two-component system, OmpR family, aerobic respiration control sensor histidine kinase ArcB